MLCDSLVLLPYLGWLKLWGREGGVRLGGDMSLGLQPDVQTMLLWNSLAMDVTTLPFLSSTVEVKWILKE